MLEAKGLCKSFGRIRALDDFTASLAPGRSFSLIGPNGSGKTTLIKCLLGTVIPDSGSLTLDGESLLRNPDLRRRIGYMPQIGRYPDNMRVAQLLEMLRDVRSGDGKALDEELLESLDITRISGRAMRTLSGGMRQRVSACLAFLFNPDVLVLDEPTAGLDPISVEVLKEKVLRERRKGKLILLTSHILSDLDEITTDVMFIIEGRLQFSRPIADLRSEWGEERLGKIIARIMRDAGPNRNPDGLP